MQTPWGELAIQDAHVHFLSHGLLTRLAAQSGKSLDQARDALGWEMPPVDPGDLGQGWTEEMDRHGVEGAALIASIPGDESSVAAAVARFPHRFYGYFMLNPVEPDALERTRQALDGGQLRGICLFPAMHGYSVQDAFLRPIFELASREHAIVFVHCGVLTVGFRGKLGLASLFDMRYSNPIDLHAVALAFPRVNFVIPHFGAGYFREALMVCDLCPNVHLDTSSSNSWMRYQPEALDLKMVFRRALDVAGSKRLLFGSDSSFFPRGWVAGVFEAQARVLEQLGISPADAALIFGGNLERLLRPASRRLFSEQKP